MPSSLHRRAALMASSRVSPATKRLAIRRVAPLEMTQCLKPWLSESLRRIERSMQVDYARGRDSGPARLLVIVLFQKRFGIECGHAPGASRGDRLAVSMILNVAGDKDSRNLGKSSMGGNQIAIFVHVQLALEHRG